MHPEHTQETDGALLHGLERLHARGPTEQAENTKGRAPVVAEVCHAYVRCLAWGHAESEEGSGCVAQRYYPQGTPYLERGDYLAEGHVGEARQGRSEVDDAGACPRIRSLPGEQRI